MVEREDDISLVARSKRGEQGAWIELVKRYTPMARSLARASWRPTHDYDDALQEGMIGLIRAVMQFDPTCAGIRFSSFAYLCIYRQIANWAARAWKMPTYALRSVAPNRAEASTELGLLPPDVKSSRPLSPEDAAVEGESAARVAEVLRGHLSTLELSVILMVLAGYSAGEMPGRLGVTYKSVDNARSRALRKLGRLVRRYGSLGNPDLPLYGRRREDLCLSLRSYRRAPEGVPKDVPEHARADGE
ncbi:MAG: sigma-70 family RNA polymerase sigma factor [Clostridia bacterium]|nr:sigma-70 family RNA polymerase sigma factor [Clostridia bacterium]